MKGIYPVLFYEEKEGGYSVFVPDLENALNCSASTCGKHIRRSNGNGRRFNCRLNNRRNGR